MDFKNKQLMIEQTEYKPIENYGIIGNQHTVALVATDGSIDFMCAPRFDSPTIFAALLDKKKGGFFNITPQLENVDFKQLYLPETNVLLSRFLAYDGLVEVTDFMPVTERDHDCMLIRKVTAVRGKVKIKMECCPHFNYARDSHSVQKKNNEIIFRSDEDDLAVRLISDMKFTEKEGDALADFELKEKESVHYLLEVLPPNEETLPEYDLPSFVDNKFHDTVNYWKKWMASSTYNGRWSEMVHRSALTLKLLTSRKFGAPVAAPTFGLPEAVGGPRNWDYRYTWIRDAAFTMYAFIRLGYTHESGQFMRWIRKQFEENITEEGNLQLMYAIDGHTQLDEQELDHLEGYKESTPVRIGNAAYKQLQLDIYGELMDSIYLYDKYGEPITYDFWKQLSTQIDYVADNWKQKDHSIWEYRSEKHKFLYSQVMCWVAMDRAIRLAEKRAFPYPWEKWRNARNAIYTDVYENFWNEEKQAFVQYKGADVLDASALLMPLVRFISPFDPRWTSTMKAIEKELVSDTLVYRYNTDHAFDGIHGNEGTFSMCSFWYVECLSRAGEIEKARLYFEKMLGYANHLGLYAEQIGLRGEQLGNYPQAFTHLGLISAAHHLNQTLNTNDPKSNLIG